jgi:hypothetical protein
MKTSQSDAADRDMGVARSFEQNSRASEVLRDAFA